MKTRRIGRDGILKGAVLVLALSFLMVAATQVGAAVVVRAKVGPVSVRIGQTGWNYGHGGSSHVYRVNRHRRSHRAVVVVERDRRYRSEVVWVPGHYVIKRNGHRKWVRAHWKLI